jgi:succinate dehydrogenase / fumarate reductase cytochrome b subunit
MVAMANTQRPLSPHIQIYRWQAQMVSSIVHRATGIALAIGSVVVVCGLLKLAGGEASFNEFRSVVGSPVGMLLLLGWSWALFYHLCNGIRHLVWDTGRGLELNSVYAGGWTVLAATAALTVITWVIGLSHWSH